VVIIGTSARPEQGDAKELKQFFDKFLHMPLPDYASRLMLWRSFITSRLNAPQGAAAAAAAAASSSSSSGSSVLTSMIPAAQVRIAHYTS
jgi:hypothetical protein